MKGNKSHNREHTHWLSVDSGGELSSVLLELLHLEHLADFVWYNKSQRCVCSLPRGFRAGLPAEETLEKMLFPRFMFFFRTPAAERRERCLPCPGGGESGYLVFNGKKAPSCG